MNARIGVNRLVTVINQWGILSNVVFLAKAVLRASSLGSAFVLSPSLQGAIYLTPVIISLLAARLDLRKNPHLKQTVNWINNHLVSLCLVALAVSNVALILLGQWALGGIALAFMVLDLAKQHQKIPVMMTQITDMLGWVLTNFSRVVLGNVFEKIVAFTSLGRAFYHSNKNRQPEVLTDRAQGIFYDRSILEAFDQGDLSLDLDHLQEKNQLAPVTDVPLEALEKLFQVIDLKDEQVFLQIEAAVLKDEYWLEFHADKRQRAQIEAYMQEGIRLFTQRVSGGMIRSGELADSTSLLIRVKHIIQKLIDMPSADRIQHLIRIALIGHYCPTGYLQEVRATHQILCDTFEQETLRSRMIHLLTRSREGLFQEFITTFNQLTKRLGKDLFDNHNYNELVLTIGSRFYLGQTSEDAKLDRVSSIDWLSKKIIEWIYAFQARPYIEAYNPAFVLDRLKTAINEGEISWSLILQWFEEQYVEALSLEHPRLSEETEPIYGQRLREEAHKRMQENLLDRDTGTLKPIYVRFLLLKMGILKISKPTASTRAQVALNPIKV